MMVKRKSNNQSPDQTIVVGIIRIKMRVLSLFDGISVAQQAIKELGITPTYYASEIDKYAISIAQKNHPNTIQIGSVVDVKGSDYEDIDLLVGGSPCQDLSIAKKNRQGLSGSRSGLFWEFVRIRDEVKPKYFLLENVASMPKEAKAVITEALGVEPIMINAALVSAQNRKRLFWTNIPNVTLPEDRGILLRDILENANTDKLKSYCIDASYYKGASWKSYQEKGRRQMVKVGQFNSGGQGDRIYSEDGKSVALSANGGGRGAKTGLYLTNNEVRKLTPVECERLQSLPDNYTDGVSNTQRYKALGNAFNCAVIKHILQNIKQ